MATKIVSDSDYLTHLAQCMATQTVKFFHVFGLEPLPLDVVFEVEKKIISDSKKGIFTLPTITALHEMGCKVMMSQNYTEH